MELTMANDTPATVPFVDGLGATRQQLSGVDPSNNVAPQTLLRAAGAMVDSTNPLPVTDAAAEAVLGTINTNTAASATATGAPADAIWSGSGSGTLVAILKALWTALTGTLKTTPVTGLTITQTIVALAAGVDAQIIAANAARKSLVVVNIDTGRASLNIGGAAVDGSGYPLMAATTAGDQGGGFGWGLGDGPPLGAVHAISGAGTRLCILEGV